jgi:hypothetical protein
MRLNPRDPRLLLLMLLISAACVAGCSDGGSATGTSSDSPPLVADENTDLVKVSVTGAT